MLLLDFTQGEVTDGFDPIIIREALEALDRHPFNSRSKDIPTSRTQLTLGDIGA